MRCPAVPCLASPRLRCQSQPRLAMPAHACLAMPRPAVPFLSGRCLRCNALRFLNLPRHSMPALPHQAPPSVASRCLRCLRSPAGPVRATARLACHAQPCLTSPRDVGPSLRCRSERNSAAPSDATPAALCDIALLGYPQTDGLDMLNQFIQLWSRKIGQHSRYLRQRDQDRRIVIWLVDRHHLRFLIPAV